ncbi:MAG: hypothetical protein M0Z50_02145 [Planctomycetia bacterium]|nr:hypothetical protein [Planctomycetia bacterium]
MEQNKQDNVPKCKVISFAEKKAERDAEWKLLETMIGKEEIERHAKAGKFPG